MLNEEKVYERTKDYAARAQFADYQPGNCTSYKVTAVRLPVDCRIAQAMGFDPRVPQYMVTLCWEREGHYATWLFEEGREVHPYDLDRYGVNYGDLKPLADLITDMIAGGGR